MLFLARNSRMRNTLCAGALSWWSRHYFFCTYVVSSLALTASNVTGHVCKCSGWWSGPVVRILHAQCSSYQGKQSTPPWFWTWPSLLSSSSAMLNSSTGNSAACSPDCPQRSMTCHLWLLSPASLVQFWVVPGCNDTSAHATLSAPLSATLEPFLHRSHPQNFCNGCPHSLAVHVHFICNRSNSQAAISMHLLVDKLNVPPVLLVAGISLLGSFSTFSFPSLKLLCHSKNQFLNIVSSPYTSWSNLSASVGVFPSRTRNFKLVRCSVVTVLQQKLRA